MEPKKLSKLVSKAKQTYIKESQKYNKFLLNKNEFIPLENLIRNNKNTNAQQQVQPQQQPQTQQQAANNNSSLINTYGNPTNAPINIVAKNYINPNAFDYDDEPKTEKKEKKSKQLAKIPDNLLQKASTDWEPINYRGVNDSYDLYKLAKVKINFDEKNQKLIYQVIEPQLNEKERKTIEDLKKAFIYVFEKIHPQENKHSESELIVNGTKKLCSKYNIKLNKEEFEKITYYLERDFLGLDIIEPIMHDPYIEDISCDGLNVPIFVNHLKYGPLEINRMYEDGSKLNSFIIKLAQKSNQEVSLSKPILQGALPDGSRVEAIYGKEVSEKGSSFTIRKFRSEPFTPIHLIEFGTMPSFLLAYLWLAVENKQSVMVSGGTATGKTTILNALSLFVPPTAKIVSIEDTPEINLPHEHWLPLIARDSQEKSQVSMFDLLKASLRERPEYIIVGEVRGAEASILFQGMATGHAGLGTVHAEKFPDLVNRMTIAPINLPKQLLTELNVIIFMKSVKVKDNMVRRATSVVELMDYNTRTDTFETNDFLEYTPGEDSFSFKEKSFIISHLIQLRGGKEESLWTEIEKRRRILEYMHESKILEFKEVSKVIKKYYQDPSNIFDYIENSKKEKEKEENQQ
jgi:flagellar protein FlaI